MDANGGLSKHHNNKAGAKYGAGYCDSQCPNHTEFINGEASPTVTFLRLIRTSGKRTRWLRPMLLTLAQSLVRPAVQVTSTPATVTRLDAASTHSTWFTVVTQFITSDNTAAGALTEIRRLYVQDARVIQNSKTNIAGMAAYDSITDKFYTDQKAAFSDVNTFAAMGGLATMDKSFSKGVALGMSVWDDHAANVLWLDSSFPINLDPSKPGVARGSCTASSGAPSDIETSAASASVTHSNTRFGDIGSSSPLIINPITTTSKPITSTTKPSTTTKTSGAPTYTTTTAPHYGQCGGIEWAGPTIGSISIRVKFKLNHLSPGLCVSLQVHQ
ncbi:beta-1,4-D-glucan cellobiohydrolase [Ceratobasidium sp. AG-Ba]|nr:beta-1,4-D-glucan cellobiohydrolase [Ceratobasidium sp. AG-Ba]